MKLQMKSRLNYYHIVIRQFKSHGLYDSATLVQKKMNLSAFGISENDYTKETPHQSKQMIL